MQSERTSDAQFTLDRKLPIHSFGDTLRERKSQAGTMNLRGAHRWTAIKGLEDMGELRLVDPDATVLNRDLDLPVSRNPA